MITQDDTQFPGNVVLLLANAFSGIDSDIQVLKRRLKVNDGNQAIGVYAVRWEPDQGSMEIRGMSSPGPNEPTLSRWIFGIQASVLDTDEERGLAVHALLAKRVRDMLYRDNGIRVGLAGLTSSALGGTEERTRRWGIESQQMMSNELQGSWVFLSTLALWLETQTI